MLNGSNNVHSHKGVSFLALVDIVANLGDKLPKNPNFWGVNKDFPAKCAKY